ncbi:hypothetical protein BGZ63DRAFT_371403 [Mariannaea sp. PMI_226]|nr:hypothetical protein BGZ63DRAFT_371403 [Mariannaea sp. PMI_226]
MWVMTSLMLSSDRFLACPVLFTFGALHKGVLFYFYHVVGSALYHLKRCFTCWSGLGYVCKMGLSVNDVCWLDPKSRRALVFSMC